MRVVLLIAVVCAACGGNRASAPTDGGAPDLSRDPNCPATAPANGAACTDNGLYCEYGGDAFSRGTTVASCFPTDSQNPLTGPKAWYVTTSTAAANPPACPSTFAAAMTGACDTDPNLVCEYAEGKCGCVCATTGLSWSCRARTDVNDRGSGGASSCPPMRPLAGDSCAGYSGGTCYYDAVCGDAHLSFGPPMACFNGYWSITIDTTAACGSFGPCPGWTP